MSEQSLPEWYPPLAGTGLAGALGIEVSVLTAARVVATMPVDVRTRQPFGCCTAARHSPSPRPWRRSGR